MENKAEENLSKILRKGKEEYECICGKKYTDEEIKENLGLRFQLHPDFDEEDEMIITDNVSGVISFICNKCGHITEFLYDLLEEFDNEEENDETDN